MICKIFRVIVGLVAGVIASQMIPAKLYSQDTDLPESWVNPPSKEIPTYTFKPSPLKPLVSMGPDGKLVYKPYSDKGDRVLDWSKTGYKQSNVPIPDVPVRETLSLLKDDKEAEAGILLEDPMTGDWRENWFLDGKEATLRNTENGLFFSAGTVTKSDDPVEYHAHHAVLWTRKEFEGDIKISYEMTRVDDSDYGTTLLYIQARGIGTPPYVEDISAWNELREIPNMGTYFTYMDLLSLSFRENLRCKRYPWRDENMEWYPGKGLVEPMVDYNYEKILPGKTYLVEVEKRAASLRLRLVEKESRKLLIDHTWNTDNIAEGIEPRQIQKGRIGLRHMSTRQFIYRDFKVETLI